MKKLIAALLLSLMPLAALGQSIGLTNLNVVSPITGKKSFGQDKLCVNGATSGSICIDTAAVAGTTPFNVGTGGTLGTAAFTASSAYEVPLTFSTGLTRTVNTVTVNTSQNIATLSNLTGNGFVKTSGGTGALSIDTTAYGTGTVTSVSVTTANGVSGTVTTSTTTPAISLTLGAITPSSVVASGAVSGSNLSGTNTGDQTITLTGDVTGSGTGSFAATLATVNSNIGSFGSATQCVTATANGKGLTTAISAATCTPAVGSVTGMGTGVNAALQIAVGSAGAPVLFNGAGGTPSGVTLTNASGTAAGLTAGHVTTNANLTGPITSSGNATAIASQTGTGTTFVMNTLPIIDSAHMTSTTTLDIAALGNTTITGSASVGVTGVSDGAIKFLFGAVSAPGSVTIASAGAIFDSTNYVLTIPSATDTIVARATTDTLSNKTLTAPAINGGTASALTSLGIRSTGAAFDLTLASSEVLTAGRTLSFNLGNAARTLTLFGSTTVPVATQQITIAGPTAARTVTLPDASFTVARTDAANTFTGTQTFSNGVSVSGVDITAAWPAFTPTITALSGTFTTVSGAGRYNQIGKQVCYTTTITNTTNGSAAGGYVMTLPVTAQSTTAFIGSGRVTTGSGFLVQAALTSSTTAAVLNYDNTYPGGTGAVTRVAGCYEAA